MSACQGVRPQPDGSVNVDGAVPIRDLNRVHGWDLPDDEATTIAGLVIHEAQIIPEPGQAFTFHGFRFQVVRKNGATSWCRSALRRGRPPGLAESRRSQAVSPGARAMMASACTGPASSSARTALIMRCRSMRLLPAKAGDTAWSLKWVSPAGRAPAWPACRCD